jgi:1,4-alpha-glucan branching enzyme
MHQGDLAIVLHAHLPFVRHPEYEDFLEERWFFEAITETYVPLIRAFDRLLADGVDFRITMTLSPPLLSMLADPLLRDRYRRHIHKLVELSEKEEQRTRFQPEFHRTALMYKDLFHETRRVFEDQYGTDLVRAFRKFADAGVLEPITCGATHGFLPFMEVTPKALAAQIRVAARTHRRLLGRDPKGIWLPECGYTPLVDAVLASEGIRYFFTDTHGVLYGQPRPKYGVFAPVYTSDGVAAFGRDIESSRSVWSADEGYPGDPDYRDFYRDIGFDLDLDYVLPYIHESGLRYPTGVKYHRITGRTAAKLPYDPEVARHRAAEHAGNFLFNRTRQIEHLHGYLGIRPIVVSPYDAELFGHWWFEGPWFLEELIRKTARDTDVIRLATAREHLEQSPRNQQVSLSFSSWGDKGYGEVWLNGTNDWIYRHLHRAADQMSAAAARHARATGESERALNQMARELLLAQASDWAFIMNGRTMVEYAIRRTKEHLAHFSRLHDSVASGRVDARWLSELEGKNCIFPDIDFRVYA